MYVLYFVHITAVTSLEISKMQLTFFSVLSSLSMDQLKLPHTYLKKMDEISEQKNKNVMTSMEKQIFYMIL